MIFKILTTAILLAFIFGAFGCAGPGFATYPAAMSGALYPYPLPYQYPPEGWHSQYVVPQVSCRTQGNMEWCRPI